MSFLPTSVFYYVRNFTGGVPSPSERCSPLVLRSTNLFLAIGCAALFWKICSHLEPENSDKVTFLKAFALACYPLHWFFTFLYYTDVGSTTAVFAMYLASLKRSYWKSAMVSVRTYICTCMHTYMHAYVYLYLSIYPSFCIYLGR